LNRLVGRFNADSNVLANSGLKQEMKHCYVWKYFGATDAGTSSSLTTATSIYPKTEMRAALTFPGTAASDLISSGQGRLKPSPRISWSAQYRVGCRGFTRGRVRSH